MRYFLPTARATGTVTETVAADGDRHGARLDDAVDGLFGTREGVDDLAGRELHVTAIDQAQRSDRIEVGIGRIEAAHQRRLLAHRVGAAARANPHVGAAVERNAEDRRLVVGPGPSVRRRP